MKLFDYRVGDKNVVFKCVNWFFVKGIVDCVEKLVWWCYLCFVGV